MDGLPAYLDQKLKKLLSATHFMNRNDVANFLSELNPEDPVHEILRENVLKAFKTTCRAENRCSALPAHLTGKPPKNVHFDLNEVKAVVTKISSLLPPTRRCKHYDYTQLGKAQEKENLEKQSQYKTDNKFESVNKDKTKNYIKCGLNNIKSENKSNLNKNNKTYCELAASETCKCGDLNEYDNVTPTGVKMPEFEKFKIKNSEARSYDKELLKDIFLQDTSDKSSYIKNFLPLRFINGLTTNYTNCSACPHKETKDIGIQVSISISHFKDQRQTKKLCTQKILPEVTSQKCDKSTTNGVNKTLLRQAHLWQKQSPLTSKVKCPLQVLYDYTDHLCNESINRLEEYCEYVQPKPKESDKPASSLDYDDLSPRLNHIPFHSNYKKLDRGVRFTDIPRAPHDFLTNQHRNEYAQKPYDRSKYQRAYNPVEVNNEKHRRRAPEKTKISSDYRDYMRPQLQLYLDPDDFMTSEGKSVSNYETLNFQERIPVIGLLMPDPEYASNMYKTMSYDRAELRERKKNPINRTVRQHQRQTKGEKPRFSFLTVEPADTDDEQYYETVLCEVFPNQPYYTQTYMPRNMTKPFCKNAMKGYVRRKKSRHVRFHDKDHF